MQRFKHVNGNPCVPCFFNAVPWRYLCSWIIPAFCCVLFIYSLHIFSLTVNAIFAIQTEILSKISHGRKLERQSLPEANFLSVKLQCDWLDLGIGGYRPHIIKSCVSSSQIAFFHMYVRMYASSATIKNIFTSYYNWYRKSIHYNTIY